LMGVFIVCYITGFLFIAALCSALGLKTAAAAVGAFAGLILGVLGCILTKHVIMLVTAVSGATFISLGIGMISPRIPFLLLVVLFSVAGYLFQQNMNKKESTKTAASRVSEITFH
jgi:hypothetical protein